MPILENAAPTLSLDQISKMQKYWNATNYLTVGQIYLQDNPLLKEPLKPEHIKPRLLGHWGTSTGLSFIYVHMNRLIKEKNADMIYLAGPGHGGPAILANVYLEGTYSEIYPDISQDEEGMRKLFRQFSSPGGVPSHVSVPTPGSIHEGGELGYVLSHAFGAVFDNPDLIAVAVVGDGEAETAPLEGAWKSIKFLNPARDGAVLPILHLNGYKISGPTVLGRDWDENIQKLLEGHGYEVFFVEGEDPTRVHQSFAQTLDACYEKIRNYQKDARTNGFKERPHWPAIVLRTPKGWTGPKVVDGIKIEGTFRSHQVPVSGVKTNLAHLKILEDWMHTYKPEECFDKKGRLVPELAEMAPKGDRRMGANPHANGGKLRVELKVPSYYDYAMKIDKPATQFRESTRPLGEMMRDIYKQNADQHNFRLFCPDETNSNRLGAIFEVENRCSVERVISDDDHVSPDGRVMEVLSEHLCQGWLEGMLLTGRHGVFATYEAFAMVSDSMTVQHSKWLQESIRLPWRAPISSLNILLTSTCWRNDHNGFSHQGPGLIDTVLSKKGTVARIYLPPDSNCLLSIADHCFKSRNYVNLIVIDKQNHLQYLNMDDAVDHCNRGLSTWDWASNTESLEPDVVLACAGDVPTLETLAAAHWLRHHIPELKVRVVNVVDLMTLYPPYFHPHGMSEEIFVSHFTEDKPVVFAFHGYQRAIHELIHGRTDTSRFHVRGFLEEGTTTTPFDMVVLNGMSRYHLAIEAMKRATRVQNLVPPLIEECNDILTRHHTYVRNHLEDMAEVRDWTWTD
ncbi:phosphoketolase family protein [Dictyobacter arantiisoli]|uniref:Putative phosphoketolase n=1 Tax=Dictyobacter arantiisoli TaxID=2014874 RepID=A0A5A5TJP9_9CHLR|nr:phosphoketolase family protein [Dictyobacter arantiisoli]GCF11475.1 putative phosphoketolase [Dictyobacter arantiisoli]